jgi:SOS response regulatory protein OraA/RecX
LYRFLGYKSISKSCDYQSNPAVNMASYKKRFHSEKEIEQMLQESGSEGEVFPKVKTVVKVKV